MLGWTKAVRRPLWLAVSGDAEQAHCRWRPARRAREPHCDCVTAPGVSRPAQTGHRTVGEQLQGEPEARGSGRVSWAEAGYQGGVEAAVREQMVSSGGAQIQPREAEWGVRGLPEAGPV